MSHREAYRGIVSGILSGDSMIIRFVEPQLVPIQNVCLEHVIAPKYGKTDGKIRDEPHAYESWNFLRNLCIGQPVLVSPPTNKPNLTRTHPAFGRMPVIFTRVALCSRNNSDVGLICVESGWVHIRAPRARDSYVNSLFAGEAAAKAKKIGIWRPNGFIRPLPVRYDNEKLLSISKFDAVVETVINGTTVALFLMPNHEHIIFQIAACRSPSAKRDNSAQFGSEARQFTVRNFLHRTTKVRLCSANHEGLFMGTILDRSDRAIRNLISEGLARFNPNTADISPSAIEYERCECEAKAMKKNIWANEPDCPIDLRSFDGEVRRILGSAAIIVDNHIVQFSCIKTPPFIPGGGSEPYGFEAHDRLRKLLIGQYVHVNVNGAVEGRLFATVYLNDVCINELLCKEGFAKVVNPYCGEPSECFNLMKKAETEASKNKIGVFSVKPVDPLVVNDYSLNTVMSVASSKLGEFKNKTMEGIVEDILGGNRFAILVPSKLLMVRVAVNGLLPLSPNDRLGKEAIAFCANNFLNREVKFEIVDVDRNGGFIANIKCATPPYSDVAELLLEEGLAEIHRRTASLIPNSEKLIAIQEKAVKLGLGKWADKSRLDVELAYGEFYPVRLVAMWNVCEVVVQFLSDDMRIIDTSLQQANQPVTRQLMKNDIVCVIQSFNEKVCRYRAKVEKPEDVHHVRVKLIDFDLTIDVDVESIFEIPNHLESIQPQGMTVKLAFLELQKEIGSESEAIFEEFKESAFYMHLMYFKEHPAVILYDKPNPEANSLNAVILDECSVWLTDTDYDLENDYSEILNVLHEISVERFGEYDEDDEDEDYADD
ncbi:Tudor domain containing protein [Tritrichomonas foetus]|uniref:Tudor domain containing protein n=1 Tax=Tritrichomonas foetus TaxID=1144522 RepID=A0A1J4JGZ9_9EUKA|nr:Tudor domain containing protein [Tritrichomonas foetus]|eukprot:OHS96532.1 Tudor domain containing protein [Tritrichomonas foetus]